ncbi:MAG: M23 family metallopeptidase [Leptonema sp. (in: Bacteria)]|nr:M23 family metallopeptidase [Leptonema sp. (in: bacteria)]
MLKYLQLTIYATIFFYLLFLSGSVFARSERLTYVVAQETKIHLPAAFPFQQPERRFAEMEGARLDLYSRKFNVGDAVYAEIRLPQKSMLTRLRLDHVDLPLTRTSFGYRTLFAIPSNFMTSHLELEWTVPSLKITKYLALRPTSVNFQVRQFHYQIRNQPTAKLSTERQNQIKKRQADFEAKINAERRLKSTTFAIRSQDRIRQSISHPRDMHYITSPIFGRRVMIGYTYRNKKRIEQGKRTIIHYGVDLRGKVGAPIFAIMDGRVVLSQRMHYEGNYTVIDHGNGIFTGYMHQSRFHVNTGQMVKAGQLIGEVGSTGFSTGPHLHATLTVRGVAADPLSLLVLPIKD